MSLKDLLSASTTKSKLLGTMVCVSPDRSLKTLLYRKPTHTDQYLSFESHHHLHHKLGIVRTLIHRANTVILDPDDRQAELDHLKSALMGCCYQSWTLSFNLSNRSKSTVRRKVNQPCPSNHILTMLTYIRGASEALCRILNHKGITVHFKLGNSL